MTALLARVPRSAVRHQNGRLEEVDLDAVEPADRLLVRQGDIVPVDGTVAEGVAALDQSALTGESMPVQHRADDAVMSGSTNVGDAFDLLAPAARRRAPMRGSSVWWRRHSARARRWRGSPTATPWCS